jgi:hypothetical protein
MSGEADRGTELDAAIYAQVEAAKGTGPLVRVKDPDNEPSIISDDPAPEPAAQPAKGKSPAKGKEPEPAPEPEPEPEPEPQPKKDAKPPVSDAKPPAKKEPEPAPAPVAPVKPKWDHQRQAVDQELANLRKEREAMAQERAELAKLRESITKANEGAAAAAQQPGATRAEKQTAADIAAVEADIEAQIASLSAGAGADDVANTLREVTKRILQVKAAGGSSDEVAALKAEVAELKRDREARDAAAQEAARAAEQAKVDGEYDQHIASLREKHGDHIFNDVVAAVNESYAKRHIGPDNPPSVDYAMQLWTYHYERLARMKPARSRAAAPKGRVPHLDSGAGGSPPPRAGKFRGKMDDVLADMEQSGSFRPDRADEG